MTVNQCDSDIPNIGKVKVIINLFISLQKVSNDSFPESDRATKRSLPHIYITTKKLVVVYVSIIITKKEHVQKILI
jgi:hypothetical protein